MEKLAINLFPESTSQKAYEKAKANFVYEYGETYRPGGFMSSGTYVKDPAVGEAKWNRNYPNGYEDWKGAQRSLNAYGEQQVIDKINEIIDHISPTPIKE